MSHAWQSEQAPAPEAIGPLGWARAVLRGGALTLVTFCGLVVALLLRQIERPLGSGRRPITPWIAQIVCRAALVILGLRRRVHGRPMPGGAVVANHSSWLDVFVLNAGQRVCFVSKAEVRAWPGVGWLARAAGTIFIERVARAAGRHRDLLGARLAQGHALLFFPEGTSTDGRRVLPFRSTLFSIFFGADTAEELTVQPVSVIYRAPPGADARFYGWWGGMAFGPHLLKVLAAPRQGAVEVTYHRPIRAREHGDRKRVARHCESVIRAEVERRLTG